MNHKKSVLSDYQQVSSQTRVYPKIPLNVNIIGESPSDRYKFQLPKKLSILDPIKTKQPKVSPLTINGNNLFKLPERQSKSTFNPNYSHVLHP